jgi:hypothetical protein
MHAFIAICLILVWIAPLAAADEKSADLVKVYCFSDALEAGFKDNSAKYFCKELGKRGEKKQSLSIADERNNAHAVVQYLGKEEIIARGEASYIVGGYAWTPDQYKNGVRAILSVGDFSKGFYGEGVNDSAAFLVWKNIEKWIRENRATILEKASQK